MGQRRHCSTHHQSTHMLRHNNTAKWLSRKRTADTASLMKFAQTKGRTLRHNHHQRGRLVMLKIGEKLTEDERKKICMRQSWQKWSGRSGGILLQAVDLVKHQTMWTLWFIIFGETNTVSCWRPQKTKSGTRVSWGFDSGPERTPWWPCTPCGASATASVRRWRLLWWVWWI